MVTFRFINIISGVYVIGVLLAALSSYWLVIPTTLTDLPEVNLVADRK
jgi:hypothetical protein